MAWSLENLSSKTIITDGDTIELSDYTQPYSGEKTIEQLADKDETPAVYLEDESNAADGYYCEFEILDRIHSSSESVAVFGISLNRIDLTSLQEIYHNDDPSSTFSQNRVNYSLWLKDSTYTDLNGDFDFYEFWLNGYKRTDPVSASSFGITDRYGLSIQMIVSTLRVNVYKNGELLTYHEASSQLLNINHVKPFIRPGNFRVRLYTNAADMLYLPADMVGFAGDSATTPVADPFNIPINFTDLLDSNNVFPYHLDINFNTLKDFINTLSIPLSFNSIEPVYSSSVVPNANIPLSFNSVPQAPRGFSIPLISNRVLPLTVPKESRQYRKTCRAISLPSGNRVNASSISGYMDLREQVVSYSVNGIGTFDIENEDSVSIIIYYGNGIDSFSVPWLSEKIEKLSFSFYGVRESRYSLTCRRKNYEQESEKQLTISQKRIEGYTEKNGFAGIDFSEILPFLYPGDTLTIQETGESYTINRIEFSISAFSRSMSIYE